MRRLLVVNMLLGIPGILYFWMLYTYLTHGQELSPGGSGWVFGLGTYFSSTQVLGPPLAIGTITWILVNVYLVNRRMRAGDCVNATGKTAHWVTALFSTMLPAGVLFAAAALS